MLRTIHTRTTSSSACDHSHALSTSRISWPSKKYFVTLVTFLTLFCAELPGHHGVGSLFLPTLLRVRVYFSHQLVGGPDPSPWGHHNEAVGCALSREVTVDPFPRGEWEYWTSPKKLLEVNARCHKVKPALREKYFLKAIYFCRRMLPMSIIIAKAHWTKKGKAFYLWGVVPYLCVTLPGVGVKLHNLSWPYWLLANIFS